MELLSIPPSSTSASSTKVLVLDGTTAKSRTAEQLRIDGGGASTTHAVTHASNGSDPLEISQSQVFDSLMTEDGSFLLTEDGRKLSIQGVDDIRDIITQVRTVSASDAILGRKSPGSGFFEELTISDALDFIGAAARGDIVYRGEDGWERLPAGTPGQYLKTQGTTGDPQWDSVPTGSIADGDKGDITVNNSGGTWTIDAGVVTTSKLGGDITTAGKALLDDVDAAAQRATLQLGSAALQPTTAFAAATHTHSAGDINSGTLAIARIPTGNTSSTVCIGDDARLSNARTPTSHTHALSDLTQSGATSGQVVGWNGTAWAPTTVSGGSGSKTFQVTYQGGIHAISSDSGQDGYGWPAYGETDTKAVSKQKGSRFIVPFKPTNYRFSAVCMASPEYWVGTTPSNGAAGLRLQYALSNSTDDADWTEFASVDFKGKALGDMAGANGTLSIPGADSLVYFRILILNTLQNEQSGFYVDFNSLVLNFWN